MGDDYPRYYSRTAIQTLIPRLHQLNLWNRLLRCCGVAVSQRRSTEWTTGARRVTVAPNIANISLCIRSRGWVRSCSTILTSSVATCCAGHGTAGVSHVETLTGRAMRAASTVGGCNGWDSTRD